MPELELKRGRKSIQFHFYLVQSQRLIKIGSTGELVLLESKIRFKTLRNFRVYGRNGFTVGGNHTEMALLRKNNYYRAD